MNLLMEDKVNFFRNYPSCKGYVIKKLVETPAIKHGCINTYKIFAYALKLNDIVLGNVFFVVMPHMFSKSRHKLANAPKS